jgi:hypothetical protein
MDCWCKTNDQEKTQSIADGEVNIQRLEAFLGEAAGKIAEMKVKRTETKEELESDQKALSEATALRLKDEKAFGKDQSDTVAALASCKSAITVLSKHNPELIEVRAVAAKLQRARVLQIGILDNLKKAALQDFFRDAQGATSFLSIPGFKSYQGQSGQIFGILNQMKDDFEDHLSDIMKQEEKAKTDYAALKKAKTDQIEQGKKDTTDLDERLGSTGQKAAAAKKETKEATEQLASDEKFLENLKKKCKEHNEEYDTRLKDRLEETTSVESAINTLNSEEAFKLFDKTTTSFLQIAAKETEGEQMRRQSAASKLERVAAQTNSPMLAMIASSVRLDAFTEVRKAISAMVAELTKQQQDEVEHKDWCVAETNENTKDTGAAGDAKSALEIKRDSQKKEVETLKSQIDGTKAAIAEARNQMKRGSETREAANADYQQTIADQRMTQIVLSKATSTLKQVYALLQNGRAHRQPKDFNKYEKNAKGAQVVAMLEGILGDSRKAEADAIKAEQNAQTTYETFMMDSNKDIAQKSEQAMTMSGNKAETQEALTMTKKDLGATNKKIDNLGAELIDLKKGCDFVVDNFTARQSARGAEMDALNEAMGILSGAK